MQENLARGLSVVSRAVSSRSTLPVLANVLLKTEDAGLKLTATNLEIGITYWVPGKIETDGAITVPAKLFADIVNGLLNKEDAVMRRQPAEQLLRPLEHEVPAQMAKNDDRKHDGSFSPARRTCVDRKCVCVLHGPPRARPRVCLLRAWLTLAR